MNDSEESDDLWAALDRLASKQEAFWEKAQSQINDLNESHDSHPTIVTDEDRFIEVFVSGNHQDTRGLLRVSKEEHFARLHRREAKAISVCKILRDRVEVLEETVYQTQ